VSWTSGLQPWLRPYAEHLVRHFPALRVTSVYRSFTEQLALYRNRARNPYPVAPPGSSKHNYGLAWDMVGPRQQLENAGRVWQSWGGTWGGQADPIHFEV
jgi:hypothetical protein